MTDDEILSGLLAREGGWRDAVQRPDQTWDPATNFGITLDTLREWYGYEPARVTVEDLRRLTPELAQQIYREKCITGPGFVPANVPFEPLRVQLIDFGVNSGPERAVRWLQRVLEVPVTGTLVAPSPTTVALLSRKPEYYHAINDALVAARCRMITQAVAAGHINRSDEHGLILRALGFTLTHS